MIKQIYSRSGPFLYMIFFVLGSFLFFYVTDALVKGFSAFNSDLFEQFFFLHIPLVCLAFFTMFSLFFLKKISLYVSAIFYFTITFFLLKNIFFHYNKMIFVGDILYIIIGILFLNFWKLELKDVIYNPRFTLHNLDLVPPMTLSVKITFEGDPTSYDGLLSNWSQKQCYILFTQKRPLKLKKMVLLEISFEGREFKNRGRVMTYFKGYMAIGVEMLSSVESYSWGTLYSVLDQRAMLPEYTNRN